MKNMFQRAEPGKTEVGMASNNSTVDLDSRWDLDPSVSTVPAKTSYSGTFILEFDFGYWNGEQYLLYEGTTR